MLADINRVLLAELNVQLCSGWICNFCTHYFTV